MATPTEQYMTEHHYILKYRKPIPCADFFRWAKLMESRHKRKVRSTWIGHVHVSTIFLGIDHNWSLRGRPVLFETMIFGGEHDEYQTRCCTWRDALKMHWDAVKLVRGE